MSCESRPKARFARIGPGRLSGCRSVRTRRRRPPPARPACRSAPCTRRTRSSSRQCRASRSAKVSTRPTWPSATMRAGGRGDGLVVDGVGQPSTSAGPRSRRHVDDQGLQPAMLVVVDADPGLDPQPLHEDGQLLAAGRAREDAGGSRRGLHSTMSGVRQARCWPPSTAIIWPVTESGVNQLEHGVRRWPRAAGPWPRGTAACSAANSACALVDRGQGRSRAPRH